MRKEKKDEYIDRTVNYTCYRKKAKYSLIAEIVDEKRKGQIDGFLDSTIR
jgi:hypothetical protein